MKVSVNAPSYRRADDVKTLAYLPYCRIWVDEGKRMNTGSIIQKRKSLRALMEFRGIFAVSAITFWMKSSRGEWMSCLSLMMICRRWSNITMTKRMISGIMSGR